MLIFNFVGEMNVLCSFVAANSVRQYKHFILIYYLLRYKNAIVAHLFWFCNQNKWQSLIAATDSIVTFINVITNWLYHISFLIEIPL